MLTNIKKSIKEWERRRVSINRYKKLEIKTPGHYYSLAPFDYYKCIFVHIPKTGGISISESLFGNAGGVHTTIKKYKTIFPQKTFDEYFKFTFVRNPWDRVVSAFFYLKAGGMHDDDANWAKKHLADFSSFEAFIKGWLNEENIFLGIHFIPQVYFLKDDDGKIPIDFIGRFENIESDFRTICKKLSLTRSLTHKNRSSRETYTQYYNSELIDIVGKVYAEDIKTFGYSFGE